MDTLPSSVDYSEPMGVIPAGTENYNVTCYAVNGASFTAGQQIIVDLNNVGYLDPASLSIRYKLALTIPATVAGGTAGISCSVPGCPVYTPILRLDTLFNSNVVESINNYNSVATALSNLEMSVSDKMGQQSSLGYISQAWIGGNGAVCAPTIDYSTINELTDGLNIVAGCTTDAGNLLATVATFPLSAPLPCLLSNAEKLVPLNGTNIRLQFTLDAQGSVCPAGVTPLSSATYIGYNMAGAVPVAATGATLGTVPASSAFTLYTITNFEVVYNQIQFPPHVERQILAMPKLRIKTSSYATGLQTLGAGVAGTVNLVYNLRYASIKAMFLLLGSSGAGAGGAAANVPNKLFESIDITSGNGSYNFQCNGVYYPQNPLSTANNKAGVLVELRRAMIDLYANNSNSMSIDATEFAKTDASLGAAANLAVQSIAKPGKFYVGVNTAKMSDKAVFSGISSQNSPITAIINIGSTATLYSYSPILMCYYDAIIEIDVMSKQVNYIF